MSRIRCFLPLFIFAFILGSCNSKPTFSVKKGDILIVQQQIRDRAETQWEDASYTDGFITMIPKGTVLEVLNTPAAGALTFECRPIEVNGTKNADEVEAFFVPESIRFKDGYKSYSFGLKTAGLGSDITKVK